MHESNVYIYGHKAADCLYIHTYIMRIVIYFIYVHDDVDVSAYGYVNVYADDNGYVYRYLYMHDLENEKWLSRL